MHLCITYDDFINSRHGLTVSDYYDTEHQQSATPSSHALVTQAV